MPEQTTEALQERERQLVQAQRIAQTGSWQWDIASDTVTWSDELYRIFGLEAEEFHPTFEGILDKIHPDDRAVLQEVAVGATATLTRFVKRHRIVRADGEVRHVESRGEILTDIYGTPATIHGTLRDRTESVHLEHHHHDPTTANEQEAPSPALVQSLERALADGEFRLFYQPKISLATDRIVGLEALIRWQHPQRGLIGPGEFIPAAELNGWAVPIGAWVMGEACRQAAMWRQGYPKLNLRVAVNVSARQLRPALVDTIRSAMDQAGLDSIGLCVEMTEATVMSDIDQTIAVLDELREIGLTISIDDFGTGYSSLQYLHRMPIDEVKVDRSFVSGLGTDALSSAIVASVISLAHAMELDVVAEGVETGEQLDRLRDLGCDFAQGYLIARPVPASEIDAYLAADAAGGDLAHLRSSGGTAAMKAVQTVLVVDDAADIRMLARMSLTTAGFAVEEAGNGAAAVALASRILPDCVLLDVTMPGMSGIDVCRALRSDDISGECTIVMLTSRGDATDKAEAFLAGADDYIVKPFAPRDLVARVRAAMRRRQATVGRVGGQIDAVLVEMLRSAREREAAEGIHPAEEQLSGRQVEILKRLVGGERVSGIAAELYVSQSTVRNHLSAIYRRLGVHSQEELLTLLRRKSAEHPARR